MCSVAVHSLHRQNAKLSLGFTTDKTSLPKACFQIPHALLTSMLIYYRCQAIICWPNNHNTDRNHIQSYSTEFTYIKKNFQIQAYAAHPACYPTRTEGSFDVIKATAKSESDERLKLKGSSITTLLRTSLCSAQAHRQK